MAVKSYSKVKDGAKNLSADFKVREFACKDDSDKILIDSDLAACLQVIRSFFGVAYTPNSAYRTETHNKKVGGSPNSQHVYGKAADIALKGVDPKYVARFAQMLGMKGVGYYPISNFTHVDTRASKSYFKEVKKNVTASVSGHGGYLSVGDSNIIVKRLQTLLNKHGAKLTVDGKYGAKTKAAVVAFQKAKKLTADGVAGAKTLKALVG